MPACRDVTCSCGEVGGAVDWEEREKGGVEEECGFGAGGVIGDFGLDRTSNKEAGGC